jgi:hypothetical protein
MYFIKFDHHVHEGLGVSCSLILTIKIRSNIQIMELLGMKGGRNSGIDIATRWTAKGSNPVWEGDFLFVTPVKNSPGAQPESCTMNTEALSWGKGGGGVWRLSFTSI